MRKVAIPRRVILLTRSMQVTSSATGSPRGESLEERLISHNTFLTFVPQRRYTRDHYLSSIL